MERQNLANLKQDLTQAERALREAQDHVKRAQQALNLHKKEAQAFVIQIQRQEEKVTQLRDQLEEATPQTGVLDSYREDLKKAQEEETVFASQYQDMVNERDRLNGAQRELKDQLDKVDSEVELAESEIKKAENHEQKLEQKRYNILLEKNVAVQAVEDAQTRLLQHQNSREEAQQELEGVIAQASAVCERVPLDRGRTTEDYESSFTRLQQDLQKSQKM
jgi:chromosome segregation ATPase